MRDIKPNTNTKQNKQKTRHMLDGFSLREELIAVLLFLLVQGEGCDI